jgi:outer membrane protein assembly factor BamB
MKATLTLLLAGLSAACAVAADWPQYYGPNRNATSSETGILRTWPKEGPKVLWTVPAGVGFGAPAISAGKVYLLDRDDQVGDTLRVYDLADGKELWNFGYPAPGSLMFPGSRTTPAVDGNRVYAVGQMGQLYCLDTNTRKPIWNKNVWTDFGGGAAPGGRGGAPGGLPTWGITQNPLIYRDLLIVASQAPEAGVVAYNKLTGELKWKTDPLAGSAGYVTPSVVKIGGEDHLIMVTAAQGFGRAASGGSVNGLDPLSGKLLWTYNGWQCIIPVPHAVDAGQGRILITGGYNAGSTMIKVEKKEDSYAVTELFKVLEFGSHTQPPILYKDTFFAQYTTNERRDGLVAMSLDGKVLWNSGQNPAFVRGGMILVDGVLLATDGSTKLYVIDPDPAGFKPLASAQLLEPGNNWAPLALVDGKLFIRDQKNLKVVQVSK